MARRRSRFVRPAKKTKMWIGDSLPQSTVAGAGPVLMGSLNAAALLLRPFTILRTRTEMHVVSDQFGAIEFQEGAVSYQVVTDSAIAAGIGSIPSPITEPEADYFVYQPYVSDVTHSTVVGYESRGRDVAWTIDSKAMRKVGHDEDIAIVVQNVNATHTVLVSLVGRQLIQLH